MIGAEVGFRKLYDRLIANRNKKIAGEAVGIRQPRSFGETG